MTDKRVLGAAALLPLALIAACTHAPRRTSAQFQAARPVEVLYNRGTEALDRHLYAEAAMAFEEVERQYPFSEWARRGILMTAYAHYKEQKYEDAISAAERFISLHPGNKDAPYAYYLIAQSWFEQIVDVGRDQSSSESALQALSEIVKRFPESEYSLDARVKMDMVRDQLAGKDMEIGRFYLRQHEYVAAINRFKAVLAEYDTTSHTPEALHRLVEAYTSLGLMQEAQRTAAVLGYNYPGTSWYSDTYKLMAAAGLTESALVQNAGKAGASAPPIDPKDGAGQKAPKIPAPAASAPPPPADAPGLSGGAPQN